MDITGHDTIFLTSNNGRVVLTGLLSKLQNRWPSAIATICDSESIRAVAIHDKVALLPNACGHVHISRDEEMDRIFDECGYEVLSNGEGPLSVYFHRLAGATLKANIREAFYQTDFGLAASDFDVTIAFSDLSMITVVTSESPEANAFARWITDVVQELCTIS
jgi:hypothetical protein